MQRWFLIVAIQIGFSYAHTIDTHAKMIADSVNFLSSTLPSESTDLRAILDTVVSRTDLLKKGVTDADISGGAVVKALPRNSFSHFYNPDTQQGFRAMKDYRDIIYSSQKRGLVTHGYISQMLGPGVSATDMSNWFYARSVHSMIEGDIEKSIRDLGYAIHFVQDASVPQHATDCGAESLSCKHIEFESMIDDIFFKDLFAPPSMEWEDLLSFATNSTAGGLVAYAATTSMAFLSDATTLEQDLVNHIGNQTIPLAIELGAAVMLKFIQDVDAESDVETVVLEITKVVVTGIVDSTFLHVADLRPLVRVMNPNYAKEENQTRGSFDNSKVADTQMGADAFGWTFIHLVNDADRALGEVTFQVEIHDMKYQMFCDYNCSSFGEQLILTPEGGTTLNITLLLNDTDGLLTSFSDGCSSDMDTCQNTVQISYSIGKSHLIEEPPAEDFGILFVLSNFSLIEIGIILGAMLGVSFFGVCKAMPLMI